mgnify:CR=1 FL=1|tara:strand:- start:1549 stop:1872 length:324 start_codon:yes stop_codon:yes gene_type:complete
MSALFISAITLALVVLLILIYKKWHDFYESVTQKKIPPWKNKCPDYWLMEGDGKCRNVHRLGKCALKEDGILDFSKAPFVGSDGDKNKCRLAKTCHIPWTGIDDKCI